MSNYFNEANNGFFELEYNIDGVYLTVHPPLGKGKAVKTSDVLERLKRKNIKDFDIAMVQKALEKSDGVPVKVAKPQPELKVDASASIMITPDKMKSFITIFPPDGGRMLTVEEILKLLKENNVVYGVKRPVLENIVNSPVYNQMVCVAEGTEPITGENGKVVFHFNTKTNFRPSILEDGRVDFRNLDLIENVEKGQKLCSLTPPKKGINGRDVMGNEIPAANGKEATFPKGRNVEISEDGQFLISSIQGEVRYDEGKVNVFSTYEVHADVDNSTGNISFVGNVKINGNVLSGFVVEAGGDIEVGGVVEGAVLKAGGDIILRRGMQGMGKGLLKSRRDVVARYIENSNVEAGNDIKAEAIMHSNIKCGNKLELAGRKGLLVGGSCKVGKKVYAKVIGSYLAATFTDIEVGLDPSLRERHNEIKCQIAEIESAIRKAQQAVTLLQKLKDVGKLTAEKEEILVKSKRTILFYSSKLEVLKEELITIEQKLHGDMNGKVQASSYIYPGTKVVIGSCVMYVKETLQHCTLYRDEADIRVGPL